MPNFVGPSSFEINYHSSNGIHSALVPTLQWNNVLSTGGHGQFDTWSGFPVDADAMINAYVDVLAPFFTSAVVFDNYIIFDQPTPTDFRNPIDGNVLTAKVGTDA